MLRNQNMPLWAVELNKKLSDKVRFDNVTLQLYSTAACFYEITPLAVVIPKNIEDVITTVNVCREYNIPILPRGAGSSLSGNAVGKAVILDMTHHFNWISEISGNTISCGVGVVLNELQRKLKKYNRRFGPDPSSGNVCVIGGMLGNNSGGPHTIKYGNMHKHVDEVNLVLSNGKIFNAKNIPIKEIPNLDETHRSYYERVYQLLKKYSEEISSSKPNTTKNSSGYQVWDILTDTHLNIASLFVGSEGTLGVFTDATLKTVPTSNYRGLISLYFTDLRNMGIAVQHLRQMGASSIEFVDHSFLNLAISYKPELTHFLPDYVKYLLYVEFEDDELANVEHKLIESKNIIERKEKLGEAGRSSTNESEIESILQVRKAATSILNKIHGKEKPVPFTEDAAVHPDVFPEFLTAISDLMKSYPFTYAVFGHAGDGNLHLRPILNFKDKQSFDFADDLMNKYVEIVLSFKGTLCAEHGDGRLRTPYLDKSFPKLIPLFKEIKKLFDPVGIMNPDIKVPERKYQWNDNLRYTPNYKYVVIDSQLDSENWREEIEKCHGCGTCREYCPLFQATNEEEATARAKANILRAIISGKLSKGNIFSNQVFKIMDYCFNCAQCLIDCPTSVNIPTLALLAKEKFHEKKLYKINEYILQRGKEVNSFASQFAFISNKLMTSSFVRRKMQSILGIASKRTLPKFFKYRKPPSVQNGQNKKKIVLWAGCSAFYNDPDGELKSSIQILEKLGYDVILPPWKCCNIAKITYGNIKGSFNDIQYNIDILLPYIEQNIPIVFSSASCGFAFMKEYPILFPENSKIKKVANFCYDIHEFIYEEINKGNFRNSFTPINSKIVYHAPCHLKAQRTKYGPVDLLNMIPELQLEKIEDSCCGIAGTYGMKKENFERSMQIGEKLFSQIRNVNPDFVLSGCGTCIIQIEQGTGITTKHPLSIINQSIT